MMISVLNSLSTQRLLVYIAERREPATAYLLWLLGGWIGIQHFYLNKRVAGTLHFILGGLLVGSFALWQVLDESVDVEVKLEGGENLEEIIASIALGMSVVLFLPFAVFWLYDLFTLSKQVEKYNRRLLHALMAEDGHLPMPSLTTTPGQPPQQMPEATETKEMEENAGATSTSVPSNA